MSKKVLPFEPRFFQKKLLQWHESNPRPMPWLSEKDPYKIWISEIILQQTRVNQGWNYYNNFIKKYPTVFKLAKANIDDVLALWEGLGYYTRARNVHHAANMIVKNFEGQVPESYEDLLTLPGIGPYAAAAISSFAFNAPKVAIDGNVLRIASRIFGIKDRIEELKTRKRIEGLLQELLLLKTTGIFNQALMNFGAIQCVPKNPQCSICPFRNNCWAFNHGYVDKLPEKAPKRKKIIREFHYAFCRQGDSIIIQKREKKDIWKGLYELPVFEQKDRKKGADKLAQKNILNKYNMHINLDTKHIIKTELTHQTIFAIFYEARKQGTTIQNKDINILVDVKNLAKFAFPKIIRVYLENQIQKEKSHVK